MRSLTLFIPGLAGPRVPLSREDLPSLPAQEFILGRARHQINHARAFHTMVSDLMGVSVPRDRDAPVAAVTRLIDSEEYPSGIWMRADPVHLSPDRHRVLLLDSSAFSLTQHDALAVATEVQQVLDADAWRLEVPFPERWYVKLSRQPAIITTELTEVAGRDIDPRLPGGSEATAWHRLMNEIQMQLHECEINREREARGDLPVNSLWFWGIGKLPDIPPRRWSVIYSDDCYLRGLAVLSMTPYNDSAGGLPEILNDIPDRTSVMVHLDHCTRASRYADLRLWQEALLKLEAEWFDPLLRAMREDELQCLEIRTEGYGFMLTSWGMKKFWRRPRSAINFSLPE